jgi:hypothetical protein
MDFPDYGVIPFATIQRQSVRLCPVFVGDFTKGMPYFRRSFTESISKG